MKENAICFIKNEKGIFEEILYKELKQKKIEYKNKKFIPIQGMLIEVKDKEYKDFYKYAKRYKYYKDIENKLQIISLNKIQEDDEFRCKDIISDNINIEFEVERKLEIEQLRKVLLLLTEKEYQIIKALFYEQKTLREYSKIIGIPYTTIQYRKTQILKKLKKLLKN